MAGWVRYALAAIQKRIRSDPGSLYVARTTGIDMIMRARGCTAGEAVAFARDAVLGLSEGCFSETVRLGNDAQADVYGAVIDGSPWYIKLRGVEDEGVLIISCHLPARDIPTRGGVVRYTARPGRGQ